jgi:hypothetical protein
VKQLSPKHREAIEASGYGPGDAYIAMWDAIVGIRNEQAFLPTLKLNDRAKAARGDYLRERLVMALSIILPYERPKLAVIQFKDDHNKGRIIDLTRLPDARLQQLKEITLLLTGAESSSDNTDDDPPGGAEFFGGLVARVTRTEGTVCSA